ncbi:MAG: hypothetical protein Kow0089_08880 [Desulfobulbaceae bacterium]
MTREYWANLALCLVLAAIVIFSMTRIGSAITPKGLFAYDPKLSPEAAELLGKVSLSKASIVKDPENRFKAEFVVKNRSDNNVKNIKVLCEFIDAEGRYRGREYWLLADTVPAMHEVSISEVSKRFIHSGTRTLKCSIVDLQRVEKPFFTLERQAATGHGKTTGNPHGQPAGH